MRIPVPKNRLVAFTLVGALLTTLVVGGLMFPGLGLADDQSSTAPSAEPSVSAQNAVDEPTPNENFSPDVQTQSYSGEHEEEEEEYGEEEEEEKEEEEEYGEEKKESESDQSEEESESDQSEEESESDQSEEEADDNES